MTETFKKLYQGELPDSVATLYTVPGATQVIIKYMVAINTTANEVTMQLWHDGVADSNCIFGPTTIPAGGKAEFDGNLIMETADTLNGKAGTSSSITLSVYGLEAS